jgi:hypothetical protein
MVVNLSIHCKVEFTMYVELFFQLKHAASMAAQGRHVFFESVSNRS